ARRSARRWPWPPRWRLRLPGRRPSPGAASGGGVVGAWWFSFGKPCRVAARRGWVGSVRAWRPFAFQLRPDGLTVLDVLVHLHFRATIKAQQRNAGIPQRRVEATQIGEGKWEGV